MKIRESHLGYWSSTRAFVWVATGAALGIGNILRLPLLMAEFGGALFLGLYVLALLGLGVPLLIAEWSLGRWMRSDVVDGYVQLADKANVRFPWRQIGVLSLIGAVLLLSFYSVIAGWSLGYMFRAASNTLAGDAAQARDTFVGMVRDPERSLAWHTLFMVIACMAVSHGFREGIERFARYLVPGSFLLLLVLGALVVGGLAGDTDLGGALRALFESRPEQLGWRAVAEAFQHAFFTLGLGFGVMVTLGAYLPARVSLVRVALTITALDLLFSLLAGTVVFAKLQGAALVPDSALLVIFEQLPQTLGWTASGIVFGTLFYLVLFMATMASAITLLEPPTRYLMERMRLTRVSAATASSVVVWYLGLGSLLSLGLLDDLRLLGRNFFDWVQLLSGTLIAPICGLMTATLAARVVSRDIMRPAWGEHETWLFGIWRLLLAYPARLALIMLLLYALGVFDWMMRFWG